MPDETWQGKFKGATCNVGFKLHLSRSQLEYLCATADGVGWDRHSFGDIHYPDNFIAVFHALERRGLVRAKTRDELNRDPLNPFNGEGNNCWESSSAELTPAGEKVIEILKLAGIFVEADKAEVRRIKLRKKA